MSGDIEEDLRKCMIDMDKLLNKKWPSDPIICESGCEYKYVILSWEKYKGLVSCQNDLYRIIKFGVSYVDNNSEEKTS